MDRAEICAELQRTQRKRVVVMKSRIMMANRIQSIVAGSLGYWSMHDEEERKAKYAEADKIIAAVRQGEKTGHDFESIISNHLDVIGVFDDEQAGLDRGMEKLAAQLPVAAWVKKPEQNGFGLPSLAVLVGECGDLANYSGPYKLFKRMSLAPYESKGISLMGSTWRFGKFGKLTSEQWEEYSYSPRRRSISYLFGEGLMKLNRNGPYRRKYDEVKAHIVATRPDWIACECNGTGKNAKGKQCKHCKGKGTKLMRAHCHARLLATKLFLKHLWCQWNGRSVTEPDAVSLHASSASA